MGTPEWLVLPFKVKMNDPAYEPGLLEQKEALKASASFLPSCPFVQANSVPPDAAPSTHLPYNEPAKPFIAVPSIR
jgi:hypothetical protein